MKTKMINGEKLKKMRENNKYTQQQVAGYLEIDQSYLAKMETNERTIPLSKLQALSALYGCTIADMINDNGKSSIPIVLAYRAEHVNIDDLHAIAKIKKITLNLRMIESVLEES